MFTSKLNGFGCVNQSLLNGLDETELMPVDAIQGNEVGGC
jgi:hypothetical protein